MSNTVTYAPAFQITTQTGAYIGAPFATLALAQAAVAAMAPGTYAIINVSLATVVAVIVTPPASTAVPTLDAKGFSPNPVAVGASVTYTGTNLAGAKAMKIGAVQFVPTSSTPTSVTGIVPQGAVSGNMAVQGANGAWTFNNAILSVSGSSTTTTSGSSAGGSTSPPTTGTTSPLTPSTAMPALSVTPLTPPATGMKYWTIKGGRFVDQNGVAIYEMGMDLSGLENTDIQGWDPTNLWGDSGFPGMPPVSIVVNKWGALIVRVPYNTASLASLVCVDGEGTKVIAADPAGDYKQYLDNVALAYTAAGCHVVFVQHWSAPFLPGLPNYPGGAFVAPEGQGAFADSITGPWAAKYMATRFSKFTNVALEGFNENYLGTFGAINPSDINLISLQGGTCSEFANNADGGSDFTLLIPWTVYGWQSFVNDSRAAGFTGPLIIGTPQYDQDLSGIAARMPTDPLNCLAIAWHYYPTFGAAFGTPAYALPNYGAANSTFPSTGLKGSMFDCAAAILSAKDYALIVTEYGGQNSAGTPDEPFTSAAITYFKANGIINIAWAGMCTQDANNVLFADTSGAPTPGFGEVVFAAMSTQ